MPTNTKNKIGREANYILKDLDKAAEIALFYGFKPIKTPKIEKADLDQVSSFVSGQTDPAKTTFPRPEEKISILRTLLEWGLHNEPLPVMVQYKRPISQLAIKRSPDDRHYALDIVGSFDSVSEAIAIRTAVATLADHGHENIIVDINSIGDKNSIGQFEKELTNFSRKYGPEMSPEIRQQFKKDPFDVWRCNHEKWVEIRRRAPQSLSFLSENSVEHFQGVLEYLETLEIPYRINPTLIGHRHFCSHTIFEIRSTVGGTATEGASAGTAGQNASQEKPLTDDPAEQVYAVGTRHNYLARRVGFKRDTPMVSVNLRFKKPATDPKLFFKGKPQPKFFFIQFGSIAKLKSLAIIEALRQARIPIHHQLTSDKFVGQLSAAEALKTPFAIIMGQKEALENSVVVRQMATRSQETVSIPELAIYLSRLNLA